MSTIADPFWLKYPGIYTDASGETSIRFSEAPKEVHESCCVLLRGETRFCEDTFEDFLTDVAPPEAEIRFQVPVEFEYRDGRRESVPVEVRFFKSENVKPHNNPMVEVSCTIDGRPWTSGHLPNGWSGGGFEDALGKLRKNWRAEGVLRCCESCKWSDYEPSVSSGHLGCAYPDRWRYAQVAASPDPMERKYRTSGLFHDWVDEFYVCPYFEERPENWGYRG